jgi:hypothetical protein
MNRRALHKAGLQINGANGFVEGMEQYFADHPRSPSAVRRPKVSKQGDTFIVLLGRDLQDGIVGLGNTVENALRAFDSQYLSTLRPPEVRRARSGARSGKAKAISS